MKVPVESFYIENKKFGSVYLDWQSEDEDLNQRPRNIPSEMLSVATTTLNLYLIDYAIFGYSSGCWWLIDGPILTLDLYFLYRSDRDSKVK